MRYPETIERSAEYLRTTIALMSKHQAALNPITYAVWYEYASGANPALNREIDSVAGAGDKLDESTTRRLYQTHIAELDEPTLVKLNERIQRLLSEITDSAARTGVDASSTTTPRTARLLRAMRHLISSGVSRIILQPLSVRQSACASQIRRTVR